MSELTPALWICGSRGSGKSSVGFDVAVRVMMGGIKAAYVDLDQIGFTRPVPADDPDNHRIKARNLGAMWPVFAAAGARCLVVSGGVDSRSVIDAYATRLPGLTMTVCRLHAGPATLLDRLLARGRGEGAAVPGDELRGRSIATLTALAQTAHDNAVTLERDGLGDVRVDTDGRSVGEVSDEVTAVTGGWPHLSIGTVGAQTGQRRT